ncbi:UNVERIFIED_CONTAM: hypothetical protein ABIC26_002740 [Paenibacillus sp. PvR008]
MKSKVMAQFLVAGDIIVEDRKKYIISSAKTVGSHTSVLYTRPNSQNLHYIKQIPKSDFLMIINDGRF